MPKHYSIYSMNLLMITRKIDRLDWLAGHSYEWAKKIAGELGKKGGKLSVICLEKGDILDIQDVQVYSLGKERRAGRMRRVFRFFYLASSLVRKTDGIFCHQNPEYAIAVWPLAFLFRKKIVSWYVHKSITWKTRLMLLLSNKVLTASKESFRLRSKKVLIVGHGIDVDKFQVPSFKFQVSEFGRTFRIVTVGRIAPVKNIEAMIEAARVMVKEQGFADIQLDIVGKPALASDFKYLAGLKRQVSVSGLDSFVHFVPAVPHARISEVYRSASVFFNLSKTGSVDKAVLEAMACGCIPITSNEAFFEMLQSHASACLVNPGAGNLAAKTLALKRMDRESRLALAGSLRAIVVEKHSLEKLAEKIVSAF